MELIGPYLAACALLVAAGTAKALRPADTARAMGALVPGSAGRVRAAVRIGAVAEATLGLVALWYPRVGPAGLVAASYVGFALFVGYARYRGGALASCGCFGTPDTPATVVHVIVNSGLALAAATVAAAGLSGTMASVLADQPGRGLPLVGASALCAWLCFLAVSVLARLQAARRLTAVSFRSEG